MPARFVRCAPGSRELNFFAELGAEQKAWAAPLKELLLEMKAAVEGAHQAGSKSLGAVEQESFTRCYDELLESGLTVNQPPAASEDVARTAGCRRQARNLLLRMQRKEGRSVTVYDGLLGAVRQQSGGA